MYIPTRQMEIMYIISSRAEQSREGGRFLTASSIYLGRLSAGILDGKTTKQQQEQQQQVENK